MIYNGFDFSPYLRVNPHRGILPPTSVETEVVPGRDGSRLVSARLSELTVSVDVEMRPVAGWDTAELRRMLAAALWSPDPAPLVLPDDPGRYLMAVVDGETELSTLWDTGEATIAFRCPDPVAYGSDREEAMTTSLVVVGGGSYPSSPVITARPAKGSYYRVTNEATGERVQLNMSFTGAGDQVVTIDCAAQHCEVNGASADRYVTLDSDYFQLQPGANRLSASSGSATVRWTERWL